MMNRRVSFEIDLSQIQALRTEIQNLLATTAGGVAGAGVYAGGDTRASTTYTTSALRSMNVAAHQAYSTQEAAAAIPALAPVPAGYNAPMLPGGGGAPGFPYAAVLSTAAYGAVNTYSQWATIMAAQQARAITGPYLTPEAIARQEVERRLAIGTGLMGGGFTMIGMGIGGAVGGPIGAGIGAGIGYGVGQFAGGFQQRAAQIQMAQLERDEQIRLSNQMMGLFSTTQVGRREWWDYPGLAPARPAPGIAEWYAQRAGYGVRREQFYLRGAFGEVNFGRPAGMTDAQWTSMQTTLAQMNVDIAQTSPALLSSQEFMREAFRMATTRPELARFLPRATAAYAARDPEYGETWFGGFQGSRRRFGVAAALGGDWTSAAAVMGAVPESLLVAQRQLAVAGQQFGVAGAWGGAAGAGAAALTAIGADPFALRGVTTEIARAALMMEQAARRQLNVIEQQGGAYGWTQALQQMRFGTLQAMRQAQAQRFGVIGGQFRAELGYAGEVAGLGLGIAEFGAETDVYGAFGTMRGVYGAALADPRAALMTPLERARLGFQYQYGVPAQTTQFALGLSGARLGLGLSQAQLAMTQAQTFGGGMPGMVFGAEMQTVSAYTQRLRELNDVLRAGTLTVAQRIGVEAERAQAMGAIQGGGFQARYGLLAGLGGMAQARAGILGVDVGVGGALGLPSAVTAPWAIGQAAEMQTAAGFAFRRAGMFPVGSPQWLQERLAGRQLGAGAVGAYLGGVGQFGMGAEFETGLMAGQARLGFMQQSLAVPGSIRDQAFSVLGMLQQQAEALDAYAQQQLAVAPPALRPRLAQMFTAQRIGIMQQALPLVNYMMSGWQERLLSQRFGEPGGGTMGLTEAGFGGLAGIVSGRLGANAPNPAFGLAGREQVEQFRNVFAPFLQIPEYLRQPGDVGMAGLMGIPTLPRSGGVASFLPQLFSPTINVYIDGARTSAQTRIEINTDPAARSGSYNF